MKLKNKTKCTDISFVVASFLPSSVCLSPVSWQELVTCAVVIQPCRSWLVAISFPDPTRVSGPRKGKRPLGTVLGDTVLGNDQSEFKTIWLKLIFPLRLKSVKVGNHLG